MAVTTRTIEYEHEGSVLEGVLAVDDSTAAPRPGVLVSHAWAGRGPLEVEKAKALAALGYAGFALDLYGKGRLGSGPDENSRLMQPFMDDRTLLQNRMKCALQLIKMQPETDENRTAAIGFCFGGLCVLDLARSGGDCLGVVSFHGLLQPPRRAGAGVSAKILILHGWDDPMAKPDALVALAHELTNAGADWQVHAYGNTMHAFTNRNANDAAFGTVYEPTADRRSWLAMKNFLAELF